jgi:hypothetical protein
MAGRASFVRASLLRHELPETAAPEVVHLEAPAGGEVLGGALPPGRLGELLATLPADSPLLVRGGGRFEVAVSPEQSDALFAALPALDGTGAVVLGPAARLFCGTPRDPGALRIESELKRRLDPRGVLV